MGIVSPFDRARPNPRERTGARPPSLRLTLRTGDPVADAALGIVTIHIRATGARLPVRLYLYVNGDLAESWTEREASFDFSLDVYGPGRHSVRCLHHPRRGRRSRSELAGSRGSAIGFPWRCLPYHSWGAVSGLQSWASG